MHTYSYIYMYAHVYIYIHSGCIQSLGMLAGTLKTIWLAMGLGAKVSCAELVVQ